MIFCLNQYIYFLSLKLYNTMTVSIQWILGELKSIESGKVLLYLIIYGTWGTLMNEFGAWAEIARFTYWWQIFTVYWLYMIPISIVLRNLVWHRQYAYGLITMCLLEFGGYALESSYAYPNNILDQWFNERNFSLGMALFFGFYYPVGNALVSLIYNKWQGPKA